MSPFGRRVRGDPGQRREEESFSERDGMKDGEVKGRRPPIKYTDADLAAAKAEVNRIASDTEFRGRTPGQHRAALRGAMTKVELIQASINGTRPRGGRTRIQPRRIDFDGSASAEE
jgi:hypothetical protein